MLDNSLAEEKKKWRACLSGKAINCYKKIFGFAGDRLCSACKAINSHVKDIAIHVEIKPDRERKSGSGGQNG